MGVRDECQSAAATIAFGSHITFSFISATESCLVLGNLWTDFPLRLRGDRSADNKNTLFGLLKKGAVPFWREATSAWGFFEGVSFEKDELWNAESSAILLSLLALVLERANLEALRSFLVGYLSFPSCWTTTLASSIDTIDSYEESGYDQEWIVRVVDGGLLLWEASGTFIL